MKFFFRINTLTILALLGGWAGPLAAQEASRPEKSQFKEPVTVLWLNTYGNIRLTENLFWVAETHFRRQETESTAFIGQMAQIYNRHAIDYMVSKNFNVSLGGVLRINYNTNEDLTTSSQTVPEWRIWHQYQFAIPIDRAMIYHRLRIEHRWSKGFQENSEYIFRNRWRYMFRAKIPINKPTLSPQAFYVSPEVELIMQSGEPVIDSPMEDLRLTTTLGYIMNPRLSFATGMMYSYGQDLSNGAYYNQKWVMRFHVYYSPDFRKISSRIPSINLKD